MFDVPWIAHVYLIFSLEAVGSWDNYTAHDERAFPWGRELASGGLDPSEHQIANVEVALVDVPVMIAP